jgi:small multidrug resistance family-3 protein
LAAPTAPIKQIQKEFRQVQSANIGQAIGFLIVATILEVSGDAVVRIALHNYAGLTAIRAGLFFLGAALVFGYATFLNLAPLEFREVVGLYIATLFVVWQAINFVFFRTAPTTPVLVGGALIVIGGLVVSFWKHTP